MRAVYQGIGEIIRYILSPPRCGVCAVYLWSRALFCSECHILIQPVVSFDLVLTKTKTMSLFSIGAYRDPLRKLLLMKNSGSPTTIRQLGILLHEKLSTSTLEFDVVVAVPLHWTRYAWRGFNQAEVLAQEVARARNIPLIYAVKRVRRTKIQTEFSGEGREANVADVFSLTRSAILLAGKRVLLVDDVIASGATMKAVAKLLLKVSPACIAGATVARSV